LLETEGVTLDFRDAAVDEIATVAVMVNEKTENIGARRLHTVLEKVLEEVSFSAPEIKGETIIIDKQYVDERLSEVMKNEDLSRYIL